MIVLDKGFDCSIEKTSAKGRSDLELIYNQDRFVFEFKVAKSDSEIESKLNQAIEQIKSKIEEQKVYLQKIIDLARELPNYELLLTIPGISNNLAARIIAEIGDINRFPRAKSLVAYVGIDPNVYQSGDNEGLHLRITKKGNKELRCLLYLAIQNTIQGNNRISIYYHKKIATGLPSKAAKVACMNKLLRIIYSMCKFGVIYQ